MRISSCRKLFKAPHVCLCNLSVLFLFFFLKKKAVLHPSQAGEYTEAINHRQFSTDGPQETTLAAQQESIFNDEPGKSASPTEGWEASWSHSAPCTSSTGQQGTASLQRARVSPWGLHCTPAAASNLTSKSLGWSSIGKHSQASHLWQHIDIWVSTRYWNSEMIKKKNQTSIHHSTMWGRYPLIAIRKKILEKTVAAPKFPLYLIGAAASPGRKPVPKWYLSHFTECRLVMIPDTRESSGSLH